jgi:cytochrome b
MAEQHTPDGGAPKQIKVWDLPTRVFHWALVALVLLSYLTGEVGGFDFVPPWSETMVANMTIHMWSGLAILALVLARVAWGFIGSTTARFANFVAGPAAIARYLGDVARRSVKFTAGHNPAGGVMVVAMLLLLLVQAGLGLFAKEDDFFGIAGPLNHLISEEAAKTITTRHKQVWEIIEVLVIVHIAANLLYWLVLKQNLIAAMITGRKTLPPGTPAPALKFGATRTAVLLLIVTGLIVWRLSELG